MTPRRSSGASSTRATSLQQNRRAAFGLQHDLLDVVDAAQIAASTHHEFGLGKFDDAPADVHVGVADAVAHFRQAECRARASRRGSTTTEYCLTKPPTLATSATPSALATANRTCQSCVERNSASVRFAAMTAYW